MPDGLARKVHYTCDLFFALTWGAVTGFNSPFPWFYPIFFTGMIIHRAIRDIQRCRMKYGKAWEQYEREVPYLFIPVSQQHNSGWDALTRVVRDLIAPSGQFWKDGGCSKMRLVPQVRPSNLRTSVATCCFARSDHGCATV